jgi:UDPglucose 6-dehydrogenase
MNIVNAEIAKLSVNTFITTKISFANMLARICEALPEANVDVVTSALGLDTRIGGKYLKGAVSYGGPCFPRDNLALAALARNLGVPAELAQATDHFNRGLVQWLAGIVERSLPANGSAGVLGLTYKPQTDVVEQSFGLLLAEELARRSIRVSAYDPQGARNSSRALGSRVGLCSSAQECIANSDVIVLATPWAEFVQIPAARWTRAAGPRTVIDCWRVLKHLDGAPGVRYISLGTGAAAAQPDLLRVGC